GGKEKYDAEQDSRSYLVLDRAAYVADTRAWRSPLAMLEIDTTALDVLDLATNDLALGLAALGRGERARADSIRARLDARMARGHASGGVEMASERGYAEVIDKVLGAAVLHAAAGGEKAVALAMAAAAQDDSLPFAFGPPVEIVSPHEMAGEYLLELNRASDAAREYKLALGRAPGRTAALVGLAKAQLALGQRADARRTYRQAAKNFAGADSSAAPAIAALRQRIAQ
ncbi:MAG TPA: tetratricopeptide repeat protein, partial [Gemmatimonadaceae bacterium]|nr:tetratricopeptide repeat protein [Gemmatimonadaceae bacterium]